MNDQSLILLIGPPSIGKSTYVKNAFDKNTITISRDDIVQNVAITYGLTYDDLFVFPPKDSPVGVVVPGYEKFGKTVPSKGRFKVYFPVSFSNIEKINEEVDRILYSEFNDAITKGKSVAIDMTNTKAEGRKDFIDRAKSLNPNIKVVGIIFNFQDPDTLEILHKVAEKRRLEDLKKGLKKTITPDVFERIIGGYEPPSTSEGFDEIKQVNTLPALRKVASQITENMKIRKLIRNILNEMEIGPDGQLIGFDDNEAVELSKPEMDKSFKQLLKIYRVEDGRIIGHKMKEYWFPIEAKKDLELIGINWGYEDRATNKEHPDYGKKFFVVDYDDVSSI